MAGVRANCGEEDLPADPGLTNLEKHIENIRSFEFRWW